MNSDVIAGIFSGLLMAAVTVLVGPIILFQMSKNPSPWFQALLRRVHPIYVTMGLVVIAYPTWTLVGAVVGILYGATFKETTIGGLGSPHLVYTVAIVIILVMMAAPFALLLRSARLGIAVTMLVIASIFGWLLPFLAR